ALPASPREARVAPRKLKPPQPSSSSSLGRLNHSPASCIPAFSWAAELRLAGREASWGHGEHDFAQQSVPASSTTGTNAESRRHIRTGDSLFQRSQICRERALSATKATVLPY